MQYRTGDAPRSFERANCNFVRGQNRPNTNATVRFGAARSENKKGIEKKGTRPEMYQKGSIILSRSSYTYEMGDKGLVSA